MCNLLVTREGACNMLWIREQIRWKMIDPCRPSYCQKKSSIYFLIRQVFCNFSSLHTQVNTISSRVLLQVSWIGQVQCILDQCCMGQVEAVVPTN